MNIALFEDKFFKYFLPLAYTRPVYELRLGLYTFRERISNFLGNTSYFFVRKYLEGVYEEFLKNKKINFRAVNPREELKDVLLLNGRLIMSKDLADIVKEKALKKDEFVFIKNRTLIAAKLEKIGEEESELLINQNINALLKKLPSGKRITVENLEIIDYPWEIIKKNVSFLGSDIKRGNLEKLKELSRKSSLYGSPDKIYIGKDVTIEDFVVLDSRNGPILIDDNAVIKSYSVIKGPAYIGKHAVVSEFSKIREGSNIGEYCKVGGETVNVIMHAYSNKVHEGFVGRTYVGEWVNLGAATVTSDLKNTFGNVKIEVEGEKIDTGLRKLGSFIGDMTKTAIGTKIYTGKRIGVASQLHGYVVTDVPSFTIYAKTLNGELVEIYLESVIKTQRKMMSSKGIAMTKNYEELIRKLYYLTENERRKFKVRKGVFRLF